MSEVFPIEDVLARIRGFSPMRRVLLATAGTLQSTMSAYFNSPVCVEVTKQEEVVLPEPEAETEAEEQTSRILYRNVEMYVLSAEEKTTVCVASSRIVVSKQELLDRIMEQKLGLGQILQEYGLKPKFVLQAVGNTKSEFWRVYSLMAPGVVYDIKETFPRNLYR